MKHTSSLTALSMLLAASVFLALPNVSAQNSSEHAKVPSEPIPEANAPAPSASVAPSDQPEITDADTGEEQQQGNPVGVSPGWDTAIKDAPPKASQYAAAPDQAEIIDKINNYFNEMTNIEGRFFQTNPDGKIQRGYFYLQRPGKVRFDYSAPSRQKIISDGHYLAIENHDLRTADRYPLDSTPFRILLKDQVDLSSDAEIIAIDIGEEIVVLTLEDKENRGRGQIRLFFEWPEIKLSEWIISDAQGLDTRIQLAELQADKETDPKLFKFTESIGLPDFRNAR